MTRRGIHGRTTFRRHVGRPMSTAQWIGFRRRLARLIATAFIADHAGLLGFRQADGISGSPSAPQGDEAAPAVEPGPRPAERKGA